MYDDYQNEYQILKAALENEDFEKAEAILLMILQKNATLPEAKLHLEKVRAKLGSVSNYEFRVKAFLDQKDYKTADKIIREAREKFKFNAKIKELIKYYNKRVGKIKKELTERKEKEIEEELPGLNEKMPNLDNVPGLNPEAMEMSEKPDLKSDMAGNPWVDNCNPQQYQKDKDVFKSRKAGVFQSNAGKDEIGKPIVPQKPPEPKIKGTQTSTNKSATPTRFKGKEKLKTALLHAKPVNGARTLAAKFADEHKKNLIAKPAEPIPQVSFVKRKKNKTNILDKPTFGRVAVILTAAIIIIPLIGLALYLNNISKVNIEESEYKPRWGVGELDTEKFSDEFQKFKDLENGILQDNKLDKFIRDVTKKEYDLKVIESFYLLFKKNSSKLSNSQFLDVENWRIKKRINAGLKIPISREKNLETANWNPKNEEFSISVIKQNSINVIVLAVLIGLLPGLLLGLILAKCKFPYLNRLFEVFWEYWFALPSIAILFVGAWVFKDFFADATVPSEFIGLLLGLFVTPHIAFSVQQGFSNISGKPIMIEIGLGILVILSSIAIGIARLIGEAVLTLGLLSVVHSGAPFAQPLNSLAAPIFHSLGDLATGTFSIIPEKTKLYNQIISIYLAYQILLYSIIITVIAQGLQIIVAYFGLKDTENCRAKSGKKFNNTNDNLHRYTDFQNDPKSSPLFLAKHRNKVFTKTNVICAFLGVVLVLFFGMIFVNGQGSFDSSNADIWTPIIDKNSVETATADTIQLGLYVCLIVLTCTFIPIILTMTLIRNRFHRAAIEAFWRIPISIAPIIFVVLAIEYLNSIAAHPSFMYSMIIAAIIALPIVFCILFRRLERYNTESFQSFYEKNSMSQKGLLVTARFFDIIAVGFFVVALTAGMLEVLMSTGSTLKQGTGSGMSAQYNSLIHQFYWLMWSPAGSEMQSYQSPATIVVFKEFVMLLFKLIGFSFIFKILSEICIRVARKKFLKRISTEMSKAEAPN